MDDSCDNKPVLLKDFLMENKISPHQDLLFLNSKKPRIIFLDTLRFMAAAAVVLQHLLERQGSIGGDIVASLSPGVFGVALFFMVSGFVIPMSINENIQFRKFIIRRIFRIYPLTLVTFLLLAFLGYNNILSDLSYVNDASPRDWITNIFLIQDYAGGRSLWGVTWTLSLEFAWYLIFILSLILIGPRFDKYLSVVAPTLLIILTISSLAFGHRMPLGRLSMIYAAILGCRLYRNYTGSINNLRALSDLGIFTVVVTISNVVSFGYFKHPSITMNQAIYPWIFASVIFSSVVMLPFIRNAGVINNSFISNMGAISFSVYLLHPFAIYAAEEFVNTDGVTLIAIVLTVIFSILGYFLVEIPGQKIGRLLTR